MSQSSIDLAEWRKTNIAALVTAGIPLVEAVVIVERIIDNNMNPAVKPIIEKEDIIDAMASWASEAPVTEADILNAG